MQCFTKREALINTSYLAYGDTYSTTPVLLFILVFLICRSCFLLMAFILVSAFRPRFWANFKTAELLYRLAPTVVDYLTKVRPVLQTKKGENQLR